jgi:transposase-like protein
VIFRSLRQSSLISTNPVEVTRLKRELARVTEERDILKMPR